MDLPLVLPRPGPAFYATVFAGCVLWAYSRFWRFRPYSSPRLSRFSDW